MKIILAMFEILWIVCFCTVAFGCYNKANNEKITFSKGQKIDFFIKWGLNISTPIALPMAFIQFISHN